MTGDCRFCDLGQLDLIFETDDIFAIWDGFSVSPGHALIIPKRHVADWFHASQSEQVSLMAAVERCKEIIVEKNSPSGFNIGINCGRSAGQTIFHLHVHLIPRYDGDVSNPVGGVRNVIPGQGDYLHVAEKTLHGQDYSQCNLIRGGDDYLLPHLRSDLDRAQSADWAVAFVQRSGLDLVYGHLQDLLSRGGRVRVLTGDYLDITDPDALAQLLDLGDGIDLRVFEAGNTSFHPKVYIFQQATGHGTAYVGSSNLSRAALTHGIEWNYRVIPSSDGRGFSDVQHSFEDLFNHPKTCSVDLEWINAYRQRRRPVDPTHVPDLPPEPIEPPPEPHLVQQHALAALKATRLAGYEAGLVVLATGLGKTWLSAFDSNSPEFNRILFVAHRDEILNQAMHTFRRIRPTSKLGKYTGEEKVADADVLFASIQTLGRAKHLKQFASDAFDYIIVDEFHHAAARTYRQLIEYFKPKFLLGLTATPERTDGGDLLGLCQENLVFRKDMIKGIEAQLLCPFKYYGVPDCVDYTNVPWRSSRFDEEELTRAIATEKRAANALEQYQERGGTRTLGFCCSKQHADFMAKFFNEHDVRSVAVHSGSTSSPRASSLEALNEGRIDLIFAVDMFNEGLDVPNIDTVLMLRPTESSTVWLQQFGRGLRRSRNKTHLNVIDYIGNHRSFLVKVRSLLQPLLAIGNSDSEINNGLKQIQNGTADFPEGCEITYDLEAIETLQGLLRIRADDDAITTFYEDFRQRFGQRPTASEVFHSGYNPRSLQKSHGSWLRFVNGMGDLTAGEVQVMQVAGEFLDAVGATPMTKSFKMLVLLALLNLDEIPGTVPIDSLVAEFRRLIVRNPKLRSEVKKDDLEGKKLRSLVVRNPVDAWVGSKGTKGRQYFQYADEDFHWVGPDVKGHQEDFHELLRELVDWRLADYLERQSVNASEDAIECRVLHSGGKPILKLPSRKSNPGIPSGWCSVEAGGKMYEVNFVKEFINVMHRSESDSENVLAPVLRSWFGEDAGLPGTKFSVRFAVQGGTWTMEPMGGKQSAAKLEPWTHIMRPDIPGCFGLSFSTGRWNAGFLHDGKHVFLLVTLQKGGLNEDYRYDDRFLSDSRFQWQSQNRTAQTSGPGQMIREHCSKGLNVHLFVRRQGKISGKAAPFIYCGQVDFESWEGEKPISVIWKLREPVPQGQRSQFDVD